MERRDLLAANAEIFRVQGRALNEAARREARVLVVGNPANTNAAILARHAPNFPAQNIASMIRLDHNRAVSRLAAKAGVPVDAIERVAVWGNHSPTMLADWRFATAADRSLPETIGDAAWWRDTLIPTVARRGTAVLEARGASSAASAANPAIDHMRDWIHALGADGRAVRRRLRDCEGSDVRRARHLRRGRLQAGRRPADRRLCPRDDRSDCRGTDRRVGRGCGSADLSLEDVFTLACRSSRDDDDRKDTRPCVFSSNRSLGAKS
jgi:hypothetical protein